jgi:hypothetical protein
MRNYIGRFHIGFHQSGAMAISFLDRYNVSDVAIRHLEKKINSRLSGFLVPCRGFWYLVGVSGTLSGFLVPLTVL